jgi:uncharacterized protein
MRLAMSDAVSIAVFAKAPIEGYAKTRLIPYLGAPGAADLQRHLIERTAATAAAANVGAVSLWCTPDCKHEIFTSLRATRSIELHTQLGDDLGARMCNAFEALTPLGPLLLVGTDCPMLEPSHLVDCAAALCGGADAVFLPTEDGGYALVGSAKPLPMLFREMPWGSDHVMSVTRTRAQQMGLRICEPATVWDIDTPADYERAVGCGLLNQR